MRTKILGCWIVACGMGMGKPGDLDRGFAPELRAWVAPEQVTIAGDGRAWLGGGFDRGDGVSTGDLVRLGENGQVAGEPAPGYLRRTDVFATTVYLGGTSGAFGSIAGEGTAPFLLENGDFLLQGANGGWLRMSAAGEEMGKAFPDRQESETISPQFEINGKLWVIRKLVNGNSVLERRESADGLLDPGFSPATPFSSRVRSAVPAPDGGAWVLAGDADPWFFGFGQSLPDREVLRVDALGNQVGGPVLIHPSRAVELVAGPGGAFRLAYGDDFTRWFYWPAPSSKNLRIEQYSAAGLLERTMTFVLGLYETFVWAEAEDGSMVATDSRVPIVGSTQFAIGSTASLRRYGPDGTEDDTFISPGRVRSVKPLADGKWLIDGLRRLDADGSVDTTWTEPELTRPANVTALVSIEDGRVLAGGDFATADGRVRNRLAIFKANGQIDPSFSLDERVKEWRSVAVSGRAIYVITNEPVTYEDGTRLNLVKLGMNGVVDESFILRIPSGAFQTQPPGILYISNFDSVHALANGDILAGFSSGYEISQSVIYRVRADGSQVPGFQIVKDRARLFQVLNRAGGGFVLGGVLYRADGSPGRDLTRAGFQLRPLCEWQGGVLFLEQGDGSTGRLRLWRDRSWAAWFRPPPIMNVWNGVQVTPGDFGTLYLQAALTDGPPVLQRLSLTGRVDRGFRPPVFGNRERVDPGSWWKAEESGSRDFFPKTGELASPPQVLLWHPASRRLWTGGSFKVVDGQPRDGLARIRGGFSRWR